MDTGLPRAALLIAVRNFFHPKPLTLNVFPETEIRILDEEGRDVPPNVRGTVFTRGPQIMKGYYKTTGSYRCGA